MQNETREAAITHAVAAYPDESCGLVVVVKGREKYIACRNVATTKSEHFVLSAEDYAEAEDMGEITAIVHSHPDMPPTPSEADRVGCEVSGVPWYILSIGQEDGEAPKCVSEYAFAPSGYEAPLVGRSFHHGVLDCYTLVRDFYQRELGITLKNFHRDDGWWERGENLYLKNYEDAGCYRVDPNDLKRGDIIIMQIRADEPNHAGVYLGEGLFIHHLYGRLSSRDVYGGYWREATRLVVRHKDVINE